MNIGIVSYQTALDLRLTGVLLRGTGCSWDLRKCQPYENYNQINFIVPVGRYSDCFDRYILRINEILESRHIILQCIDQIPMSKHKTSEYRISAPLRNEIKISIEGLIEHFKFFSEGIIIPSICSYLAVESPKGEFGTFILSKGTANRPYRCKISAPGFFHLQALNKMTTNHLLSDLVTIIGTQDIVFGEVDR
jgi:NADH:ubiquinone oxidoreductase subunit D